MNVHLCYFSGAVADLTRKQSKDSVLVLRCIDKDPMVSTWDMGEKDLWRTIYALVGQGFLKDETKKVSYPWHRFVVTKKGKKFLAEASEKGGA